MSMYYPINLVLKNRKCVVIGAGSVAQRKVRRLLECGARVLVVSPSITPVLKALSEKKKISYKKRRVGLKDLKGAYLVIAATTDRMINSRVSSYCRNNNILINVVDYPEECTFIVPSIVRRGDLTISISTGGISPALARSIRVDLGRKFGKEYAEFLRIMKALRPRAQSRIKDSRSRKTFFQKALRSGAIELLKRNKKDQAKRTLERILENARP